jgi:hypothetical protein
LLKHGVLEFEMGRCREKKPRNASKTTQKALKWHLPTSDLKIYPIAILIAAADVINLQVAKCRCGMIESAKLVSRLSAAELSGGDATSFQVSAQAHPKWQAQG